MDLNWQSLALLSAFFAGLTAILAKAGVRGIDSNLATAIRTSVVLFMAWGIAGLQGSASATALSGIAARTWMFLGLSGIATGASWLCYFRALQLADASKVAPLDKLSVVVAMGLAALLLGESLNRRHWCGGGLIVIGAWLVSRA